ncbi:MAG TPA: hypothetical protein VFV95_09360 [Vicinamibacterales bacterium]|nr:hypothetical protein [Vicinamibacterales bacterium]
MYRRMVALGAFFALLTGSHACDEKLSDLTGPTPDLEVRFSSIQEQIFENTDSSGRSACIQCHNNQGQLFAGRLNLTHDVAYDNLVNVASRNKAGAVRVIPGDPENSYLIHKLEGRAGIFGLRMPQNGPPYLIDGQISVIKRWIERGAAND